MAVTIETHLDARTVDVIETWSAPKKAWVPGAEGIGPYSGKETLSLLAWIGSWVGLHYAFRRKEMSISRALIVFVVGVGIATTWIWPPVFNGVAKLVAGH